MIYGFGAQAVLGTVLVGALFALYGYVLWTRPVASKRSANQIRSYLSSRVHLGGRPYYSTSAAYSAQRAVNSFSYYEQLSKKSTDAHRISYNKLSPRHKHIAENLDILEKMRHVDRQDRENGRLLKGIAGFAKKELGVLPVSSDDADLYRAREAIKHLVRDWSAEGRAERDNIHQPVLDALKKAIPDRAGRAGRTVLLPGSGMGRLGWEIAQLGFEASANEFSNFMTLPLRFLMSETCTSKPYQHTLYPFHFTFSHVRRAEDHWREIRIPDVLPRATSSYRLLDVDFYSIRNKHYDFIITQFFIDTSVNIIECLERIHDLLTPGGIWINLGPLLWTSGSVARMELSLQEILFLAEMVGFELQGNTRQVDTEYTADPRAMMRYIYEAEFWIAKKVARSRPAEE